VGGVADLGERKPSRFSGAAYTALLGEVRFLANVMCKKQQQKAAVLYCRFTGAENAANRFLTASGGVTPKSHKKLQGGFSRASGGQKKWAFPFS
jgi:hypothetical protein